MWWRKAIVASILGLWLVIGIAWGPRAALAFSFFVFVDGVVGLWAVAAGDLTQRAGAGYYERQLSSSNTGHWRDHATQRRR